nr:hypothetical protein [Tanacetum cinerariifolium]
MNSCPQVSTLMDTSEKLKPNTSKVVSQLEYYRVIDYLMYAMTCTMHDIAFAVGKQSRYSSNPSTQHWKAVQRVLKYLKKTIDYSLSYTGYPLVLVGYTNASWINITEDNYSTSGWVFLLGGGAISRAFNKQTYIISSTIAATLEKAYSQMYNGKSRHLGVRHSMICEIITNEVLVCRFLVFLVMVEPDINNMTLNEYLMYKGRHRDLARNYTSRKSVAPLKNRVLVYPNSDEEDEEYCRLPPLLLSFQNPQLCIKFNSVPHNVKNKVDEDIDISIAKEKEEVPMKDVEMDEDHNVDHSKTIEALQWNLPKTLY